MGFLSGFATGVGPGIERAGETYAQVYGETRRRREDRANQLEDKLAAARQKAAELGLQVGPNASLEDIQRKTGEFMDPTTRGARQREQTALDEGYEDTVDPNTGKTMTGAEGRALFQQGQRDLTQGKGELDLTTARNMANTSDPKNIARLAMIADYRKQNTEAVGYGITNIYNSDWSVNKPQMDKFNRVSREITAAELRLREAQATYYETPRSSAATHKYDQGVILAKTLMPGWIAEMEHYPDSSNKHILEETMKLFQNTADPSWIKKINDHFTVLRDENEDSYKRYRATKQFANDPIYQRAGQKEYPSWFSGGAGGTTVAPPSAAALGGGSAPTPTFGVTPEIDPTPAPGIDPTPAPGIDSIPAPEIDPTPAPGIDPTPAPGIDPTPAPEAVPAQRPSLGEVDLGELMPEDRNTLDKIGSVMAAWEAKMADESLPWEVTEEQKVEYLSHVFLRLYKTISSSEPSQLLLTAVRQKYPQYAGTLTNE